MECTGMSQKVLARQELDLYEELLDCLEEESQALVKGREEAILAVAGRKEALLERLLELKGMPQANLTPEDKKRREHLKRRAAAANARNREIAAAFLEVIQEFLALFQPPDPGLYQPAKPRKSIREGALFERRA